MLDIGGLNFFSRNMKSAVSDSSCKVSIIEESGGSTRKGDGERRGRLSGDQMRRDTGQGKSATRGRGANTHQTARSRREERAYIDPSRAE